jgi:hypothetical protein
VANNISRPELKVGGGGAWLSLASTARAEGEEGTVAAEMGADAEVALRAELAAMRAAAGLEGAAAMEEEAVVAPAVTKPKGVPAVRYKGTGQGLTLVHFSTQGKRFLWVRGAYRGRLGGVDEVLGGIGDV